MFTRLRHYLYPPALEDPRRKHAALLLHYTLLAGIILTVLLVLALPYLGISYAMLSRTLALGTLGGLLLSFVLLHNRHETIAAHLAIGSNLAAFGAVSFLRGIASPDPMGMLLTIIFSSILLDSGSTLLIGALDLLLLWAIALTTSPDFRNALPYMGVYTPMFIMTTFSLAFYRRGSDAIFERLQESQRSLVERNAELDALRQTMEKQVQERTRQLEEQSALLERTLRVSHQVAQSTSTKALLERAANLIHREFELYHVGIYLLDASGGYVVLQAASSKGGQQLLAEGHRVKVGGEGIIGAVAASRRARIALDTATDPFFVGRPELPQVRSEAVLPLLRGEHLLGILDIESNRPNAFDEKSVSILQHLADQIASAIENARLHAEGQQALRRAERAYAEISARSWREYAQSVPWLGFRTALGEVMPLQEESDRSVPPEVSRAIRSGQVYTEGNTAILPVQVRHTTIASLRLRKASPTAWSREELRLMQAVSDQIAQALESARLYQESQKRAAREELLSASTARMRATLDLETVLQTAVRELRAALGLSEAEIRLGAPPPAREDDAPAAPTTR